MQIKRFEAKNMTTALKLIKKELGPAAVILSARSLKVENRILGSIKKAGVEVTAATDTYHMPAASNLDPYAVARPVGDGNVQVATSRKKIFMDAVQNRMKSFASRREATRSIKDHHMQNNDVHADFFKYLLSQGVARNTAREIAEAVNKEFNADRSDSKEKIISKITAVIKEKRNSLTRPLRTKSEPKVQAFIGPSGVGKTTAIAKLAARQAIQRNQKVALITIDSCRIGAVEELKVYGKAIGIPVTIAATPSALTAAINEYGHYDVILVDTPAINVQNPREVDDLHSYLEVIQPVDIHLLLSAGAKAADLFNTIERLSAVTAHALIFTKLDESTTFGNLVNLLIQTQLPLSFLTSGRKVPDSITTGSIEKIVEYLLADYLNDLHLSNSETAHQRIRNVSNDSAGNEFVANKNSDVFHCPDCKWTQKIKPNNMITFSSVQDAKAQRFVPCRDCQPAANEPLQTGFPASEKMRISSYL